MATRAELEEQLAEVEAEEVAEAKATATNPIKDQIAASTAPSFLDALREVAGRLSDAGEILESDIVGDAESKPVLATLVKLVGELVK